MSPTELRYHLALARVLAIMHERATFADVTILTPMATTRAPVRHKAHRAGPIERDVVGRLVQTCLRCDRLLFLAGNGREPYRVGRRVFLQDDCRGTMAAPAEQMMQYEDDDGA